MHFKNEVPKVIAALESKVRSKGKRTFIPPAFYGRNGNFVQPPSFEMPCSIFQEQDVQEIVQDFEKSM